MSKLARLALISFLLATPVAVQAKPSSVRVPAATIAFQDIGGPMLGAAWGDTKAGPHGSFLRLPANFVSPVHIHTAAYDAVVISGRVTNSEIGQKDVVLSPGSFYRQAGGAPHVTKCLTKTPCLLYIRQDRGFDFIPK